MTRRRLDPVCSCVLCALGAIAVAAPDDCYFLQSSGCGTGETFCAEESEVCDMGYSKLVDTGCGRKGPLSFPGSTRQCWTLTDATTGDCDDPNPSGLETVGCTNGSGLCCYAIKSWSRDLSSSMLVPSGDECCDVTVE